MRTVLFINTHSRQAKKLSDEVIKSFKSKKSGFEIVDVIMVKKLSGLNDDLERLKKIDKLECVIVGSGDGTIVSVLNALSGRKKIVYGFLPLGTSNVFVRSLELPLKADEAIKIIRKKRVRSISLGAINNIIFANSAGIGLPVSVVSNLTDRTKKYLGPMAYVVSGLIEFVGHKALHCSIKQGSKKESFYTHHILIANGKYHGNLPVSDDASVYKNKLVIVAFGVSASRWQYAKSIAKFGVGKHEADPNVRVIPFEKIQIETVPKQKIEADGELISTTPATIEIVKNAIRVFTA